MPNSKRIPTLDAELYRQRNQIERIFCKRKYFRASIQPHPSEYGCGRMSG